MDGANSWSFASAVDGRRSRVLWIAIRPPVKILCWLLPYRQWRLQRNANLDVVAVRDRHHSRWIADVKWIGQAFWIGGGTWQRGFAKCLHCNNSVCSNNGNRVGAFADP
jgi:hypothetical protein